MNGTESEIQRGNSIIGFSSKNNQENSGWKLSGLSVQ